ncbi:PAS domain S-box protein [Fulvivirgaceae bacterium PWU5]|uniref:PAS domain S-box protein n=2 Tax=Dawidia cretensis TaxID=2782350 RepID=A0AAP2E0L6_9BACT|nr:PAS domain S-box protein [Dawidia cretensis]
MVENKPTDLFHGHPLPAWICEPHTARILDVNQAAVAAFGYSRQQSLGICVHDILREQERPYEVHTALVMHEDRNCWLMAAHPAVPGHAGQSKRAASRLEEVMRFSKTAIAELMLGTGELTLSAELLELLEEGPAAPLRMTLAAFIDKYVAAPDRPLIYDKIKEGMYDAAQPVNRVHVEFRMITAAGNIKDVEAMGTFMPDGIAIGMFRDVTRRKQRNLELQTLSMIANRTSNGILMIDARGQITWANQGFERISGYTLEDVVGRVPSFLHGPETNPETVAYMENMLRQGRTFRTELINYTRDGAKYWVDVEVIPLVGEGEEPRGFMVVQSDITSLKMAVQEMLKSEELLRKITDHAPLIVFMKDLQGRYTFYNKLFEDKFIKVPPPKNGLYTDNDLFEPSQAEVFTSSDQTVLSTGRLEEFEQEVVTEGKCETYLAIKFPLRDEHGQVYALAGVALSITERKRNEVELYQKRRALRNQNQVLEIINLAQLQFIRDIKPTIFFDTALQNILALTESEIGFIGEVLARDGQPYVRTFALIDMQEGEIPRERDEDAGAGIEFFSLGSPLDRVIRLGETVITNKPSKDPRPGYPPLRSFIGIPILRSGIQVGVIGLANKAGGYGNAFRQELQPLVIVIGYIIEALRADQDRKHAEFIIHESEKRLRDTADSLAKSEARYRSIVNDQPEMICRFTPDWRMTFVNRAFERMFNSDHTRLIGQSVFNFIPERMHGERLEFLERLVAGTAKSLPLQHDVILGDGTRQWQEWLDVPLRNEQGEVYEIQSIGHDITARKKLEAEQARLDKIVRESYNEIYLFNIDTLRFEFANTSALKNVGYSIEELTRMKFSDLFYYPDEFALQALLGPLRRGETDRVQLQIKHSRKNGVYYDVDTFIQLLEGRSFVAIATDITQKLITEKKLIASVLEKEVLIKEIHHRVKNNLQLISSIIYIKILALGKSDVSDFLENTRKKIHSIALIHERLLQTNNLDKVEISDYLGKMLYDLQAAHDNQSMQLTIKAEIPKTVFDLDTAIYCGLIVNELVTNAMKHAFKNRDEGTILVSLERDVNTFILQVRDDGTTLPESIVPGHAGSFGMQLIQIFAKQLGGAMEIIRGKGTIFLIRFNQRVV